MMIRVSYHLRNAEDLGSMKPFSEGEPGSLGKGKINGVYTLEVGMQPFLQMVVSSG